MLTQGSFYALKRFFRSFISLPTQAPVRTSNVIVDPVPLAPSLDTCLVFRQWRVSGERILELRGALATPSSQIVGLYSYSSLFIHPNNLYVYLLPLPPPRAIACWHKKHRSPPSNIKCLYLRQNNALRPRPTKKNPPWGK